MEKKVIGKTYSTNKEICKCKLIRKSREKYHCVHDVRKISIYIIRATGVEQCI